MGCYESYVQSPAEDISGWVFYCKMHNGEKLCTYKSPSRTRCTSVVEHQFMVQWVVGSIPHDRLIELFLVPASGPQLV